MWNSLLFLILTLDVSALLNGPREIVQIKYCIDGDTCASSHRLRLAGVDAPELSQPFGPLSFIWLNARTAARTLSLVDLGIDRYGRRLVNIYDGKAWINQELLAAGLAVRYRRSPLYAHPALARAESEARSTRRGLWSQTNFTRPEKYRQQAQRH